MTRTTASVLVLGTALALAGCSSHNGSSASSTSTTASVPATSAAVSPSGSAAASASTQPSGSAAAASSAAPSSATNAPASSSAPATATSPGSSPTATPTTSTSPTPTAVSGTRCRNSQLKVSLGQGDAGAGNQYTSLVFTNTSSTTCTLAGHPGVSYVAGDKGVQVGRSAVRNAGTIRTVSLAPGKAASALLHEVSYGAFDPTVCKPVTTRGLRVYPPGSTAAFFVPRVAKECSGTDLPGTTLSIGVVKAGTDASV